MSTFRLQADSNASREIEIGLGVRVKLRWDAASAWDIAITTLWRNMSVEERAQQTLRLASEHIISWNLLGQDDQPVEFSREHFVAMVNQEPGFLLAFASELVELGGEAWRLEKKVSLALRSGTRSAKAAATADDAPKPNSHVPEAFPASTESSVPT
jgi:hypothetical protein